MRKHVAKLWQPPPTPQSATLVIHPRHVCPQILSHLDVALPAEQNRWWRRQLDGETPHLLLVSENPVQKYRGPIWTEDRYTSGKHVTARVLISATRDYFVEIELKAGGGVVPLQVTARNLRMLLRSLDAQNEVTDSGCMVRGAADGGRMERLLDPERRADLCR